MSRSRARRLLVAASALAVGAALAACSSGGAAATDGSGRTTLTVYGWKGGDAEPANIAQVNAAFAKANPDIDLKFEYIPANETYTQRVQPELLAGTGADVIMTDAAKVQDWGSAGYLQDLSDGAWTKAVRPELAPFVQQGGATYALPMEVIGIDLYANLDLLQKAGVAAVPTTWDEFLADLQKVRDAGITPIALPNKNGWTGSSVLNSIAATTVYQAHPTWDADFLAGRASFTDWTAAAQQMMALQDKGFVDFKAALGVDEWKQGLSDFQSGRSAFYFQGAWNQSTLEKAGVKDVFVPWPAGAAGQAPSANLFVGTMWSVNARTKVADAAKRYLDFWADPANAAPYLQAENAVTPFTGAATPSTDATKSYVSTVESGKYRILPSNSWFGNEGEKAMQQQVQSLWLGQVDVAQFTANLDAALRPKQ